MGKDVDSILYFQSLIQPVFFVIFPYMFSVAGRNIKGVAFDLEGTIVDLEPFHFAAHVETARRVGVELNLDDPRTFTELVPNFIGGPSRTIQEQIRTLAIQRREGQAKEIPSVEEMLAMDREHFLSLRDAIDVIPPREGFLPVLQSLKEREIPIAIGSLTPREDAEIILHKSGLDQLFDPRVIILADDVAKPKPDPEVYRRTAQRMNINPEQQLVFEDSHNGVKAAIEAGSLVIGMPVVDQPAILARLKQEGAIMIYRSWRDISLEMFTTNESREINNFSPHKERK